MEASVKGESHIVMTTPTSNKILPSHDRTSVCLLVKLASNVVYKDNRVVKNRKRFQYFKSLFVDIRK